MKITKIKVLARDAAVAIDLQQEYNSLKALHAVLGREIKLNQIDELTFTIYPEHINLSSDPLKINKDIDKSILYHLHKVYPSEFTDFLHFNGAKNANQSGYYKPFSRPAKKQQPQGEKQWTRNSQGFWVQL